MLRSIPKHFATLQALDRAKRRLTLLLEGETTPHQWPLATDAEIKLGLAVLIAGFAAYVSGMLPVLVPLEVLPRLWTLPVADYVRETGMATGWGAGRRGTEVGAACPRSSRDWG